MSCIWSDQSEFMSVFMAFNLWVGPGFIFGFCRSFLNFTLAIFPLLPLD